MRCLKDYRGPAKGYIEALEARLCDTEEVLSRVLTYLSADEVSEALLRSNLDSTQPSRSYSGLLLHDRKQAVDVWTNFPLKSADDVKRWHRVQGGSGKIGGALPQDSRGLADAQSAADCGVMSQGPRKNDGRLQSVDGFASTEQEAQQINADENESATGDDTNTAIEGQSNRQSSTVGGQSRMQPHPQSSRSNGVLGLSREFQDRFLW